MEVRKIRSKCVTLPQRDNRMGKKEAISKHNRMPVNFPELIKDTNH